MAQRAFLALVVAASILLVQTRTNAGFIQQQRAQGSVYIEVNITPNPLGYHPRTIAYDASRMQDAASVVAANQGSVPVQANVTPNPTGTLLQMNPPVATVSQMAGTTSTVTCAFQVQVTTTVTRWTLDTALSSDFTGSAGSFPGKDMSFSQYEFSPPSPQTWTPYVVYAQNNNSYQATVTAGGSHTYCVDLQLTSPISTPGGSYSTNAVYTVFY